MKVLLRKQKKKSYDSSSSLRILNEVDMSSTRNFQQLLDEKIFKSENGGVLIYMDKRINVVGSNLSGTNINSGENVSQTIVNNAIASEHEELFEKLVGEIKSLSIDEDEKQDAIENTEKVKDAIAKGNTERAKKLFGWLPTLIQSSSVGLKLYEIITNANS